MGRPILAVPFPIFAFLVSNDDANDASALTPFPVSDLAHMVIDNGGETDRITDSVGHHIGFESLGQDLEGDLVCHPGTRQPLLEIDQPGFCFSSISVKQRRSAG
jgi:hypothetical protein